MTIFDDFYRGYSNALESFSDDFHHRWIAQLQRTRIQAFLGRAGNSSEAGAVDDMIRRGLAAVPADPREAFDWLWWPEIGLLSLERQPGGRNPSLGRGAALALHLASRGVPGAWQANVDPAVGLRFDRWWINDIAQARLESDGSRVAFSAAGADGRRLSLAWEREGDEWRLAEGDLPAAPVLRWRGARILLMPVARGQQERDQDLIAADERMVRFVGDALDLIDRTSPAYTDWVSRMLRIIVPWRPTPGLFRNASNPNCCGCVMMTVHPDIPRVAETFVHEISHHYFDVLESASPLVNGRDTDEYWSPPRREMRPLRAILVAHHAFMNCLLYYQLQEAAGIRMPSDFGRTFAQLEEWQRELERHLSQSDGLTATGEMLWRRLSMRISLLDTVAAA